MHFFEIMQKDYDEKSIQDKLNKVKLVSIGPFTGIELEKFHIQSVTSEVHTVPGAFDTMNNALA